MLRRCVIARKGLHTSLSLILLFAATAQAMAETAPEKVAALQKQLAQVKEKANKTGNSISKTESELREFDKDIASAHEKLRQAKKKVEEKREQTQALRDEQASLTAALSDIEEKLSRQLQAMYQMGRQPYLKMFLNEDDPAKLGRMMVYYRYFNTAYMENINHLNRQIDEFQSLQTRYERETRALNELLRQREKDISYLETKRKNRQEYYSTLKKQHDLELSNIEHLLADQKRLGMLSDEISGLGEKVDLPPSNDGMAFAKRKGRLNWPVNGAILANYGGYRANGGQLKWRGVLLRAVPGEDVHSVAAGRVVFADWLRGFGYLIIVDHGDGYMTLYGHNEGLTHREGDVVAQGDVIAMAGSSGREGQSGVYFEVRYKGEPINPSRWMLSKR